MKKIAILVFEVKNNLGGILPSTLNLCNGLEEIGCKPFVFHAEWKTRSIGGATSKDVGHGLRCTVMADSRARLYADGKHTFLYKGREAANELRERLSEYDGVIMATSIPSLGDKKMRENQDWKIVLRHGKPMLSIVRDCHWEKFSLHILPFRHLFMAFMGVHPAAYKSLKSMPWRIGCQVNPFDLSQLENSYVKNWEKVCITSWFKKWKHIDDAIRAVPYMKPIHLHVSGGGIEKEYMLAANHPMDGKGPAYYNKLSYYTWMKPDYNSREEWHGKSVWKVAEESGNFHYRGFLLGEKLSDMQGTCGGLIDPSYHYEWGEHFNRVIVEAMLHKCIPFARPYGISDNSKGEGRVFGPENVVLIPENATPKQFGEIVKSSMNDLSLRKSIFRANSTKLGIFDRKIVAKNYIEILKGGGRGLFGIKEGRVTEKVQRLVEKFGIEMRFPRMLFPRRK